MMLTKTDFHNVKSLYNGKLNTSNLSPYTVAKNTIITEGYGWCCGKSEKKMRNIRNSIKINWQDNKIKTDGLAIKPRWQLQANLRKR